MSRDIAAWLLVYTALALFAVGNIRWPKADFRHSGFNYCWGDCRDAADQDVRELVKDK